MLGIIRPFGSGFCDGYVTQLYGVYYEHVTSPGDRRVLAYR